jgi:hypothetical protein
MAIRIALHELAILHLLSAFLPGNMIGIELDVLEDVRLLDECELEGRSCVIEPNFSIY